MLTTTTTAEGPEEIRVALLRHSDKATVGEDNLHGEDLISGQTIDTGHGGVATAKEVTTTNADSLGEGDESQS